MGKHDFELMAWQRLTSPEPMTLVCSWPDGSSTIIASVANIVSTQSIQYEHDDHQYFSGNVMRQMYNNGVSLRMLT